METASPEAVWPSYSFTALEAVTVRVALLMVSVLLTGTKV